MSTKNSNYTEKSDGFYKNEQSTGRGGQHLLDRPAPPVRDTAGRPLLPNGDGRIDIGRWIKEVNDNDRT